MQHYIRRQDSAGYHRENHRNIVQHTRALLRCNPNDSRELVALRLQIQQEQVLTEREWLLEQLLAV
jgi:hypothetical protein